jgi:hypothetical protein
MALKLTEICDVKKFKDKETTKMSTKVELHDHSRGEPARMFGDVCISSRAYD